MRAKNVTSDYKVFVGELQLNDDVKTEPAGISEILAEVKKETTKKLSVKLNWTLDQLGASPYGMVYNDEGNVDHFEVLYKNGENGRVSVVSHVQGCRPSLVTCQWLRVKSPISVCAACRPT